MVGRLSISTPTKLTMTASLSLQIEQAEPIGLVSRALKKRNVREPHIESVNIFRCQHYEVRAIPSD